MSQLLTLPHFITKKLPNDCFWIIYVVAFVEASWSFIVPAGVLEQNDTHSFLIALGNYSFNDFYSLFDFSRPPIYPLFLGLCRVLTFGWNMLLTVALMQWLVFIISIHYFKLLLRHVIGHRPRLIWWATLFYVVFPGSYECNYVSLTESLSMTCLIFFIYTILRSFNSQRYHSLWWSALWLTVLLLIKPAFIYLIPLMFVGWCIVFLCKKSLAIHGLISLLPPLLLFIGYCSGFQHKFGFFAPSIISTYNSDINVRTSMVSQEQIEEAGSALEAAHLEAMQESVEGRKTRKGAYEYYSAAQRRISDNRGYLLKLQTSRLLGLFNGDSNYRIFRERGQGLQPFTYLYILLSPLPMKVCIYVWLIYSVSLIYAMIRRHTVFYSAILVSTIWISNLFVAWYGSWGDYGRLNQAVFPLFIIMGAQLLSVLSKRQSLSQVFKP